jgi:endonuclease YncB( thermonuclease family)
MGSCHRVHPFKLLNSGAGVAVEIHLRHSAQMIYRITLSVFVALAGLAVTSQVSVAVAEQASVLEARVSKVQDGDTFTLKGQSRRIRVWGLDAPEWNHPGGSDATATLRQMISGETLTCQVLDMDRYGRYVAQCFLPDGRDIAAEMIRAGVATEYCRYSGGFYGTC